MKETDDESENASVVSWTGASMTSSHQDSELPNPAAVHNMQKKLDREMVELKERKQKLIHQNNQRENKRRIKFK